MIVIAGESTVELFGIDNRHNSVTVMRAGQISTAHVQAAAESIR